MMAHRKRKKIGLTGGIGSGKTTVAAIFKTLGIPVYFADSRAKQLMTQDPELIRKIKQLFGERAYLPQGDLNRAFIAQVVFADKEKLAQLNAWVHPAVARDYSLWHERQINAPYTLKEAALIFESGGHHSLDAVIEVFAAQRLRIDRVRKRDGVSRKQVLARIRNQMPEREKVKLADFVIRNDGRHPLIPQVLDIHHKILQM